MTRNEAQRALRHIRGMFPGRWAEPEALEQWAVDLSQQNWTFEQVEQACQRLRQHRESRGQSHFHVAWGELREAVDSLTPRSDVPEDWPTITPEERERSLVHIANARADLKARAEARAEQ